MILLRDEQAKGAAEETRRRVLQRGQSKGCCRGAVERCWRGSSRRMLLSFASEAIIIFL
jgi:hypothetical protein